MTNSSPGETVACDVWTEDRWVACGGESHFDLTREEAEAHRYLCASATLLERNTTMPKGRTALLKPILTPEDVLDLQRLLRAQSTPYGVARRAQVLLALHGNMTQQLAAETYGLSRQHVRKWIKRWNALGMEGIRDRRNGRPSRKSPTLLTESQ